MFKPFLLKLIVTGVVALALMIPAAMIRDLIAERQQRSNEAVASIAEGWGKRQTVAGPYLAIPYERHWTEVRRETVDGKEREAKTERSQALVLRVPAASVEWTVAANIHQKARGIYKARLYGAKLQASGTIAVPARASSEDGKSRYKWHTPRLVLGISDPLGIRAAPDATVDAKRFAFSPGTSDGAVSSGLHAPLPGLDTGQARTIRFSLSLELGGSEAFAIAPLGADAAVAMRADWPHPSFQGRFLPASHDITASGFSARWKVSRFAAQAGGSANCAWPCSQMAETIALSFVEPTGLYQRLERASKYAFLFIGLTVAAFMLFELLRRLAIHPIQYGLVGLALAMFFLLLTALSEHMSFVLAYAVAAFACVALITAYVVHVLRSARTAFGFGVALACMYAALYGLLRAEDYALVGGALLLFALLAATMLATRRVDWYALDPRSRAPATQASAVASEPSRP